MDLSRKSGSGGSNSSGGVKVEPMEVDPHPKDRDKKREIIPSGNSDLVISAIKTTCSVSLDKSKVDLKLLRKSDFKPSSGGENVSGSSSGVQLTALPAKSEPASSSSSLSTRDPFGGGGRERAEADTSSKSGVTITAEKASSSEQIFNSTATSSPNDHKQEGGKGVSSAAVPNASGVTIEQVSPSVAGAKGEENSSQHMLIRYVKKTFGF